LTAKRKSSGENTGNDQAKTEASGRNKSKFREYFEAILLALLLALFIRTFVVQAFKIPSPSMVPTLLIGDHILVNKFLYGIKIPFSDERILSVREPKRGDVIVFRFPGDRKVDFIKRCIAVEGETIQIQGKQVYIDGQPIEDPHARFEDSRSGFSAPRDNFGPVAVPEGKIFMMGDNRDNSNDSRFWGFVDIADVKGKAMVIYWSWNKQKKWPRFGRIGDGID